MQNNNSKYPVAFWIQYLGVILKQHCNIYKTPCCQVYHFSYLLFRKGAVRSGVELASRISRHGQRSFQASSLLAIDFNTRMIFSRLNFVWFSFSDFDLCWFLFWFFWVQIFFLTNIKSITHYRFLTLSLSLTDHSFWDAVNSTIENSFLTLLDP